MIQLNLSLQYATDVYEALDNVLSELDVYVDDAEHLEILKDLLEYRLEKLKGNTK